MKAPDLREIPDLPQEIKEAALCGEFVLFIGAGVSNLVKLPNWKGLAKAILYDLQTVGLFNFSEIEQLLTLDPKKQLSIAKLKAEQNGESLNFVKHLIPEANGKSIYNYLNKIGCVCVTTNFDELLSPEFVPSKDGSTVPVVINRISSRSEFLAHHLNTPGTVIHLHGAISHPETIIATTKDYLEHYDDGNVMHFLSELFDKKVVLFIGYGLEEAEILEHILRRGKANDSIIKRRFAIQGFFQSEKPLYENLYEYYSKSFGVHLIGFIRDHKNFTQLEEIVKVWAKNIEVRPPAIVNDLDYMDEVFSDDS